MTTTVPVIGAVVTYHGSLTAEHGRTFLLQPSNTEDPVYHLVALEDGEDLDGVRPTSFTDDGGQWWPEDAVHFLISGYAYKAHHTEPTHSATARFVHYHTALGGGGLRRTWCRFDHATDEIRTLDARHLP
ncbi:hypothetical protein RM572_00530 [Streptomyces sp. DSM 42041]|uniref:Uncharacterized protein n=1 Tax=Streptomyces hazeniae TaxID=3075538 RepID=A0ABU2NJU6_9ACTN|nr:hypothetical protein [Streptomyces sp. DSM 42041]MDT0377261.1 hypothetical protein [Streptomyces sp. DSM 42041]